MKFTVKSIGGTSPKATQYVILAENGDEIDLWLPNQAVTVENNIIEIPDWLILKNDILRESFPEFIPAEPIKETMLDVLLRIEKLLKEIIKT